MKKPQTMLDEAQPRNITRADVLMTEGFGLEVDGRMKRSFPTLAAAQKSALDLKTKYPMLQVKVYDAEKKTNGKLERYVVRIDLRVVIVRYRLGFIRRIPNVKNS